MAICLQETKIIKIITAAGITLMPLLLWSFPNIKDDSTWTICLYKNLIGQHCFGCGSTRAILCVVHFEFIKAFHYNKLIVIIFPLLTYLWVKHSIIEWRQIFFTTNDQTKFINRNP